MIDYDKDMQLDPDSLDVEWLEQPTLAIRYAKAAAQARKEMDLAKDQLDVERAELDAKIRSDPEKYGIVKITEATVQNTIILSPSYKALNEKYINAKYEADMAGLAVRAIEHRKSALENLVRLHGQQYFAGPSVPRDLSQEYLKREMQKNSDKTVMRKRSTIHE